MSRWRDWVIFCHNWFKFKFLFGQKRCTNDDFEDWGPSNRLKKDQNGHNIFWVWLNHQSKIFVSFLSKLSLVCFEFGLKFIDRTEPQNLRQNLTIKRGNCTSTYPEFPSTTWGPDTCRNRMCSSWANQCSHGHPCSWLKSQKIFRHESIQFFRVASPLAGLAIIFTRVSTYVQRGSKFCFVVVVAVTVVVVVVLVVVLVLVLADTLLRILRPRKYPFFEDIYLSYITAKKVI
jgi:hypothetical protein